jgi:hypothetical protein
MACFAVETEFMEIVAIFTFFFSELIAGILVYAYCRRHRSGLGAAKAELTTTIKDHYRQGTLEQYIGCVASGTKSILSKKGRLTQYLCVALSGIAGACIVYFIKQYAGAGVALRTIVGVLAMLPFIGLLAMGIAEEADENKISDFEKLTAKLLLQDIKEGNVDQRIAELSQGTVIK